VLIDAAMYNFKHEIDKLIYSFVRQCWYLCCVYGSLLFIKYV